MMISVHIGKMKSLFLATILALSLTGCIYDKLDDCPRGCEVTFVYDRNMKHADAAASEVRSVSLFAADADGRIVYRKASEYSASLGGSVSMDVSDIPSGKYKFVAWAEGEQRNGDSYFHADMNDVVSLEDLYRYIRNESGNVSHDLTPLFHGIVDDVDLTEIHDRRIKCKMSLTKNTNVFRVVLQQASGNMNPSDYRMEITDDNAFMDWTNALTLNGQTLGFGTDSLTYSPWSLSSGSTGIEGSISSKVDGGVNVVVAEFTTGRLVVGHKPILSVYNVSDNRLVFRIPLVDYALLVKGNYNRKMDDQEYLDCQDEYNMTFFLDENGRWLNSSIVINSWVVVLNDVDI